MNAVVLVCVSLLLFEGVSPEHVHVQRYSRAGENVNLPCDRLRHHGPTCSHVKWEYFKDSSSSAFTIVSNGKVQGSESRRTRDQDCSLSLQNVTEQDSGVFRCDLNDNSDDGTSVYLNVLTVSQAPADSSSNPDGKLTLQCRLWTYGAQCENYKFHWFDKNKEELSGKKENCVSSLTVEIQNQNDITFTCQYEESGDVKISAEYRPERNKNKGPAQNEGGSEGHSDIIYIIVGAVVSLLVLLVVAAVVLFKIKSERRAPQTTDEPQDDPRANHPADREVDPESGVTYAAINHQTPRAKNKVVMEDAVTYSAVSIKTAVDSSSSGSSSAIYSTVNKTKQNSSNGRTIG